MSYVLLIGAGFSRNWGGLLASEVFEHLISDPEIDSDPELRRLLWDSGIGGFEDALAEVQTAFAAQPKRHGPRLRRLEGSVARVFGNMNRGFFALDTIEFQQSIERMLRTFLTRFDAIFTLNQDVLMEHHYIRHIRHRWAGAQLPGMHRIPNYDNIDNSSWGRDSWVSGGDFRLYDDHQPFFKLHGSSNWKTTDGGALLIMGGRKNLMLRSHPVLAWYFDQFRQYLTRRNTRLFVIGYSFRDSHINEIIIDSVQNYGLRFFLIDPSGADIVRRFEPSQDTDARKELEQTFRTGLTGVSRRPLRETFGNDPVAHAHVMTFFR